VFDVRAVVTQGTNDWNFVSQVRLGANSKYVSNIAQGGKDYNTELFLLNLFSKNEVVNILDKVEKTAKGIAQFLVEKQQANIDELAVDIMIDSSANLYIAELNTDPILLGSPKNFGDFLKMTLPETYLYETTTLKHGELLAELLMNKLSEKVMYYP
jgi:hypothetical protein